MRHQKINAEDLSRLVDEALEPSDSPPPPRTDPSDAKEWYPDLNPTQVKAFNDPSLNILLVGEKGSGKTTCACHMAIRHAYDNDNALVIMITTSLRTGFEGIWYDLDTLALPHWKDGIGLEYTASKLDPLTKDRHRWVRNRHGGWSKIMLMSIAYAKQVESRIKAPAPSMIIVEEITNTDGPEYYVFPKMQLGRRRGIQGPQQYIATCNPEGPSNWVHAKFYVENSGDKDFALYHVPVSENLHRLPPGYLDQLKKTLKNDPIQYRRLVLGEWIDRPKGDGILSGFWNVKLHTRGDVITGTGLLPIPGHPIIIGYDLGQMWSNCNFMQCIPIKDSTIWIHFDEIDHFARRILYKTMAMEVIDKMRFWRKHVNYQFNFIHIADSSALNMYRPGTGTYDAAEFEKEFNKVAEEFSRKNTDGDFKKMKMLGCPKGAGSIAARVRLLQGKLSQDEFIVSALCKGAIDMMNNLEADSGEPEVPERTHPYIDKFDGISYPIFKIELNGRVVLPQGESAPRLIRCGQ